MSDNAAEDVGTVGEEAAKLIEALAGWAKAQSTESVAGAATAAASAAAALNEASEHVGGEDCRYCPICQGLNFMRETSPEVKLHLASAASSLFQALSAMVATHPPHEGAAPVEHVDLEAGEWG